MLTQIPEKPTPTPEGFAVCTPMSDNAPPILINNLPSLRLFGRLGSLGRPCHPLRELDTHTNKLGPVTHAFPTGLDVGLQGSYNDLVFGRWNPDSDALRGLFQVSRTGSLSPLILPMLHSASNNLLSEEQASDVMDSLLHSGSRNFFNALISTQSPATKAVARSLLPSAIRSLDVPMVKSLLDTGISPDSYTQYSQERPLQLAASVGCVEMTRLLLHYGAKADLSCSEWTSLPLTIAAHKGLVDLVQLLLEAGADVNASCEYDPTEMTALQVAAEAVKPDIVRLLLGAGANINAPAQGTSGQTALQAAVRNGNIDLVRLLLSHGADVNAPGTSYKSTALQAAASAGDLVLISMLLDLNVSDALVAMEVASNRGHIQIVQALLSFGQRLGHPSAEVYEIMALKAGVRCGDYHFVRRLLASGVDVNASAIDNDAQWTTALQVAARKGDLDLVQLLMAFLADVNAPAAGSYGLTALQGAASTGNVELVRLLLSAGADVNASRSEHGMMTLAAAARCDNYEILQILLDFGADIVKQGREALEVAIEGDCSLELIHFLLELNFLNGTGVLHYIRFGLETFVPKSTHKMKLFQLLLDYEVLDTAHTLGRAIEFSNIEVVKLLLQSGVNVNDQSSNGVYLCGLEAAAISGELGMMQLLSEYGTDVEEKSRALQGAAYAGQVGAAEMLIKSKADVNAAPFRYKDLKLGRPAPPRTALQAAAGTGSLQLVRLLLEAGADVESKTRHDDEEGTALQFAAISGSISVASELIQNGADVNAPPIGAKGRTALEGAAEHGRLDMIQLLLNVDAEVGGSRAVHFARDEGHDGVVQFLLENGFEDSRMDESA
jgi:ankyrin repeat protein